MSTLASSLASSANPQPPDREVLIAAHLAKQRRERVMVLAVQTLIVVSTLAIWELLVRLGVVRELLIGQPSRIGQFIVTLVSDGTILRDSWVTTVETVVGFIGGLVLGGAAGLVLWWSRTVERVLDPVMVALNSIPKIALTPIFLLWFGVGIAMKLALSFATVFLVTFLTAAASLHALDNELLQLTAGLGASRWRTFRYVVIPSSLPWLVSAMKLSIGFALTGAVVGEFVSANEGLGYLLLYGAQIYEMSMVWAGIVALLVIAMIMYWTVAFAERRLLKWMDN